MTQPIFYLDSIKCCCRIAPASPEELLFSQDFAISVALAIPVAILVTAAKVLFF